MFCCGSSAINPSTAEFKYFIKDGDEDNIDSLMNDNTPNRQKLKPSSNQTNPTVGESFELRLFSSELCWKSGNIYDYQSQLLSTGNKSFLYYELVNGNTGAAPAPRSTLVSVLRNTVLLTPIAFNVANIWTMLIHSFHSFNKHVAVYHQSFSIIRFPALESRTKSTATSQPATPSFTSLEHVFMISDILLAAFVNNFDESMELSANDKPSLLQEISILLVQLNNLLLVAPEDSRRSCAIAFSQATMKLLQLLFVFLKHIQWNLSHTSHYPTHPTDRITTYLQYIHEVVDLFPAINQTMSFLKSHCGEESLHYYINTMLLWSTYEYYLSLIIQLELLFTESTYKLSMKLLQNKLIACLLQVLPSTQDLLSEIKRMEQYQQSTISSSTAAGLNNKTMASQQQKEDSNLSNWIRVLLNKDQVVSARWPNSSSTGTRPTAAEGECIFTFRFRHLLLGLLKYITLYIPLALSTSPLSQQLHLIQRPNFPNKEETFVLLYEVFSYLLPFGKSEGGGNAGVGMMTTTNQPLMHCLPFLTNLMLKLSLSIRREPSVRWIYWSLAQKLLKFNERLRLYFNSLLNIAVIDTTQLRDSYQAGMIVTETNDTGRQATASPAMISSPNFTTPKRRVSYSNNVHSVDSYSTSHKNVSSRGGAVDNTTTVHNSSNPPPVASQQPFSPLDVAMETPFKGLNSDQITSPSPTPSKSQQQTDKEAITFKLDDLVDGLCTLPNGSKRWFPGKIIEVIPRLQGEFLYSILYHDGEIGKDKPVEEIRLTKTRATNRSRDKKKTADSSKDNTDKEPVKSILITSETRKGSRDKEDRPKEPERPKPAVVSEEEVIRTDGIPTTVEVPSFDVDYQSNPLDESLNSNEMLLSPPSEANESPRIVITKKGSNSSKSPSKTTSIPVKSIQKATQRESEEEEEELSLFTRSFGVKVVEDEEEGDLEEEGIGRKVSVVEDNDLEDTSGEESEEDRIFEIPSIFDQPRQLNYHHLEEVVPRMQFTNLPITSALPQIGASPSLSSSLLPETTPGDASMFTGGGGFHSARLMGNDYLYVTPGSARKFSGRSIGNNSSNALTAGISFQKSNSSSNNNGNNSNNNGTNTGLNSALGTSRSHQAALTNRSEFDLLTIPNSSRSIPQGKRTPNRRRSLSNQGLEEYNQSGKVLLTTSLNGGITANASMHSISREPSMMSLIHTRSNMINTATATVLSSGMNSVRSTPGLDPYDRHLHNNTPFYFAGIEQLEVLLETFTIVVMMLLSNTFHPVSGELDYNCCSHHPEMSINTEEQPIYQMLQRLSSKSGDSMDSGAMKEIKALGGAAGYQPVVPSSLDANDNSQMNSVFIIREFMELTYLTQPIAATLSNTTGNNNYYSMYLQHQQSYTSPPQTALRSPPAAQSILSPGQQLLHPSTITSLAHLQSVIMKSLTQFILYLNPSNEMLRLSKLLHPYYFLHSKIANYLIPLNKFEKQYSQDSYETELNKIGEGAFGTVYRFTILQKEEVITRMEPINAITNLDGPRELPPAALTSSPLHQSQEKQPRSYWDSFSQYSHCFSCYRREHYYFDETNYYYDDAWDHSSSDLALPFDGSIPLEFSRTQGSLAIGGGNRASFSTALAPSNGNTSDKEHVFCQCWKAQFHPHKGGKFKTPKVTKKVYAVKKVMRERSIHDLSMLYNLYQEILCLEKLSECIGICGIEDYGLSATSQEYILVLENGFMNILDWRQHYLLYKNQLYSFYTQERIMSVVPPQPTVTTAALSVLSVTNQQLPATAFSPVNGPRGSKVIVPELMMEKVTNVSRSSFNTNNTNNGSSREVPATSVPSPVLLKSTVSLSLKSYHEILSYYHQQVGKPLEGIIEWDCLLFFHLYYEIILILQYIHSQQIIHFDIKLANFVLRDNPMSHLPYLQYMHGLGKPSGILFLTDFGEAMYQIEQCTNKRILQKSRGTMPIQSPEMLSISESQTHHSHQQQPLQQPRASGLKAHRLRVEGEDGEGGGGNGNGGNNTLFKDESKSENVLQRKPLFLQTPEEIQRTENNYHQRTLNLLSSGASITSSSYATGITTKKSIQFPLPSYASDIWSLGCLFFELLSGEMIFQQQSFPELYTKLCLQAFPASSTFVLEAIDQFLNKNQNELQQLRQGSHKPEESTRQPTPTPTHSTVSFPKESLNRLLLDIMQQTPSNRLSLSEIAVEMKKIIEEYSQTTQVKLQVSEKLHHHQHQQQQHQQAAAKKWKDFYQSQGNNAPAGSSSQKYHPTSSVASNDDQDRGSTKGPATAGLTRNESDYSSVIFQTADPHKIEEKSDPAAPIVTISSPDRGIGLRDSPSVQWDRPLSEKSYFTIDLTDEIHTLVTRSQSLLIAINNNNHNKSQGNLSRRSSLGIPAFSTTSLTTGPASPSALTSIAPSTNSSQPQDCLRFSNYLFFFSDNQFQELLQSLPNLSLLQSMGKNRHQELSASSTTIYTNNNTMVPPPSSPIPPALGANREGHHSHNSSNHSNSGSLQSQLKSYYDLEEKHQYHFDQFLSSNHITMNNSSSTANNSTNRPQSATNNINKSQKHYQKKASSPRSKHRPEAMQTSVTINPNALLLTPNYQLFSANLALEQLLRPPSTSYSNSSNNTRWGGVSPASIDHNNKDNSNSNPNLNNTVNVAAASTSNSRDLRRASNSSSTRSLPVDPVTGNLTTLPQLTLMTPTHYNYHWMEVIPSLLLKDLLSHYQYYSLEGAANGNPDSDITPTGAAMLASASNVLQKITPLPIVGIYLRYEIVTSDAELMNFVPKVECSKHPSLSNIFFYTLFIPILIQYPTTTTTEKEGSDPNNNNDNNPEIKLHVSIEKMIYVLKEFLLHHFIPTYAHHYPSSKAKSSSDPPSSMKPLVFLFSSDAYRVEEERELRKLIILSAVPFGSSTIPLATATSPHKGSTRKEEEKEEPTGGVASEDRSSLSYQQKLWIISKVWMTIQQLLNSGRLVLSGFITRYLQEDLLSTPKDGSHSGDALQSILQSILTFIRYLPLATTTPVYDYQYEGKNELKSPLSQPTSPFAGNNGITAGGGGGSGSSGVVLAPSSGFSYSMPLIERLLYFFFASLQVDYSMGSSGGLPYSPVSPLLPRSPDQTLSLAKTTSQLQRIASIRNVLISSIRSNHHHPYTSTTNAKDDPVSSTRNSYPFSSLRKGREISHNDFLSPTSGGGPGGEGLINPQTSRSSNNSRLDAQQQHHSPLTHQCMYQPQQSLFAFLSRSGSDFMHHMFALTGHESSQLAVNTSQKSKKRKPLQRKRTNPESETTLWSSFWKQFQQK